MPTSIAFVDGERKRRSMNVKSSHNFLHGYARVNLLVSIDVYIPSPDCGRVISWQTHRELVALAERHTVSDSRQFHHVNVDKLSMW